MSASDLVHLTGGLVVPRAVYDLLVIRLEGLGARLRVDGPDLVVEGTVPPALLAELRRWKPHAIMLLRYQADDRHLYDQPRAPRLPESRTAS